MLASFLFSSSLFSFFFDDLRFDLPGLVEDDATFLPAPSWLDASFDSRDSDTSTITLSRCCDSTTA